MKALSEDKKLVSLSKSKYCKGIQCPKILWMDRYMPEEAQDMGKEAVFRVGNEVGDLARSYFGESVLVEFDKGLASMVEETKMFLEQGERLIAEASFSYNFNFCSVDILKVDVDGAMEIVEVKSSTSVHDIYYDDMAYQYYVLTHCGYKVKKVYNMHINNEYIRQGDLDLQKLFKLEDCTEKVLEKQPEIEKNINEIRAFINVDVEPERQLDLYCEKPYECEYKAYCHKNIPEDSVFSIHGLFLKKKYEYYKQGIVSYRDIMEKQPKLNDKQWRQVKSSYENKAPEINKTEIRNFLNSLSYPLYHLDFETYQQAIPLYDGVKPYMQIPFQYSLHVQRKTGELEHYEFLGKEGTDPRRKLAEQLCEQIPLDACTLAFNMQFEKMVIKSLADIYPDLKEHLMNIHDNMKDLMVPFQKQYYYCKEMKGSYSIKWVLPALCSDDPELNYGALDGIHNGTEAMNAFADLPNHTIEEIEGIRKQLLAYCRLDTLAMVKILEKLEQVVMGEK